VIDPLAALLDEIRGCRHCEAHLPLPPRPLLQAGRDARVLIVGQAPGRRAHDSGTPWDDASGDRLRAWMGVDAAIFYDPERVAIMPAGFCYPGKGASGDLPPRPECAPLWHARVRALLPRIAITLAVGAYAHGLCLPKAGKVTENVRAWRHSAPALWPLPHPSPRNRHWLRANPWFEAETLPALKRGLRTALDA